MLHLLALAEWRMSEHGGVERLPGRSELYVDGSDYLRSVHLLLENEEIERSNASLERLKMDKGSYNERRRALTLACTVSLSGHGWPGEVISRVTLRREDDNDFQVYPSFGEHSPWFPGYMHNTVNLLEFDDSSGVRMGAVLKWCNQNASNLAGLDVRKTGILDSIQALIGGTR